MRHGLISIALIGLLTLLPSQLFASKVHPSIIQFKKSIPNKKVVIVKEESKPLISDKKLFLFDLNDQSQPYVNSEEKRVKIYDKLRAEIEKRRKENNQEPIEVHVALEPDYPYSKEQFIKDHKLEDKVTDIAGMTYLSFHVKLSIEEIEELSENENVFAITTIDDYEKIILPDFR